MKNYPLPRKTHQQRKEQIIDAAISLMGRGGIQMLTTKNLANLIGVSEPTLYRHFSDKVDIVRQVLENLSDRIDRRLAIIAGTSERPEIRLKNLIRRQFLAFSRRPEIVVVLLSEGLYQNNRELSALIYSIMSRSAVIYAGVISDGQSCGDFRTDIPAERLAFMIMGNLRFCTVQWHLSGCGYDLIARGEEVLDTILTLIK